MPNPEPEPTLLVQWIERRLSGLAVGAFRRPALSLVCVALLSGLSVLGAARLSIDPSMTELLPERFESVRQVRGLAARIGGVGYVAVVLEGAPATVLERAADALAPQLAAVPGIRYVETGPSTAFFETHALYYLSVAELEDVRARLQDRIDWEKLRKNPFYIDLEGAEPPELSFDDLRTKLGAFDSNARPNAHSNYYVDAEAERLVILAKPDTLASDMAFSARLVADVQEVLDRFDASAFQPAPRITQSGRYRKKVDLQQTVTADLRLASSLALGLVFFYLWLHFRRVTAIGQVLLPLLLGLGWTYGLGGWLFGSLNILTAFVGVVLLGLGIDNGIHLLSRYSHERAAGHAALQAFERTFARTGRAAAAATLTTVAGFASLAFSEFRAFRELGVLAGAGMLLVLLAYALLWPALTALRPRVLAARNVSHRPSRSWLVSRGAAPWVVWVGALLAFAVTTRAIDVRFDDDFAALEPRHLPAYTLDAEVNRLLGRSQTPLVFLSADPESARAVSASVRTRARELGAASGVDHVLSLADLVPKDQPQKRSVIDTLATQLDQLEQGELSAEARAELDRLRSMVQAQPFGREQLPTHVRRSFEGVDRAPADFVWVFPRVSLSDGAAVRRLAAELHDVPAGAHARLSAAGEAMVVADVLDTVFRETPRSVALALAVVCLALYLLLGSVRLALLAAVPALLSLAVTVGLMPLVGLDFNYLNVIMLPVLLGMGVDGGSHMALHLVEGEPLERVTNEVGRAVFGALTTTALGFGALLWAAHPALRALAQLAVLGLAVNLIVTVVLLPSFLRLYPLASAGHPAARTPASALAEFIATCGRAGLAARAPGSLGALLALPFAWLTREFRTDQQLLWLSALTLASTLAVHRYLRGRTGDPQEVVVDEWIGCLITLACVPLELPWLVAGYLLFRAFDIAKPGPIGWLDRHLHGALGVMGDDVAAGLSAGGLLALLANLAS